MKANTDGAANMRLWLAWTLATGARCAAGMFAGALAGWSGQNPGIAGMAIFAFMIGAGGGVMQWLVLRRQVDGTAWWAPATAAGYMLAGIALEAVRERNLSADFDLAYQVAFIAMAGLAAGALQWPVLRRHAVGAGWWLAASVAGVAAGSILSAIPASLLLINGGNYIAGLFVTGAALGVGVGAISGVALVRLLRASGRKASRGIGAASEPA